MSSDDDAPMEEEKDAPAALDSDEIKENEAISRLLLRQDTPHRPNKAASRASNKAKKDTRICTSKTQSESNPEDEEEEESFSPANRGECQMKAEALKKTCQAFCDVAGEVLVTVESGRTFDLRSVQIKKHVPSTKKFRIFTYKNPKSKRYIKVLKCDHEGCPKWFRKWHNFFDHLRIHTNERPYVCPHVNCGFSFT